MIPYTDELENQIAQVVAVSQELSIDPQEFNTKGLLDQWAENKEFLYQRFGNQLIKSLGDYTLDLPAEEQFKLVEEFNASMYNTYGYRYSDLADFIYYQRAGFFENKVMYDYNYRDTTIKAGMKLLRAFKYFIEDEKALYDIQTAASMVVQNGVFHGELCVSIHPLDFLSSSENISNWRSCHSLDGAYRGGNLSYMVDNCTFICYIKSDKEAILPRFPASIPWNNKKWRMLVHTNDKFSPIFAGRQYPFDIGDRILVYIRDKVAPLDFYSPFSEPQSPSIKLGNNYEGYVSMGLRQKYYYLDQELVPESGVIEDGDGALNFNDLKRSTLYTPKYSFATGGLSRSRWKKITVGGAPLCPCCGRYDVTYNDALVCENCLDNYADNRNYIICDDCGARVHIDDSYWVDETETRVCGSCYDNHYGRCDCCGDVYSMDSLYYDDDSGCLLCPDCRE